MSDRVKNFKQMSPNEREAFLVFSRYEVAGVITPDGLRSFAEDFGFSDYAVLKALLDADGSNTVSFAEFVNFWQNSEKYAFFDSVRVHKLRAWLAKFEEIDVNKDGTLCEKEIREFCEAVGYVGDAAEVIRAFDKDGSGTIGFEEFLVWCRAKI